MTTTVLNKSDLRQNSSVPIYRDLADHIIEKINSGKLVAGDKLPTEHSLANHLGINRLTVRKSYQVLENKNLVERRRGMGTFISEIKETPLYANKNSRTIYFLIPHPIHITLQLESSILIRRLVYGATMENSGNLLQTIPVSQKFEKKLTYIDWNALRQIPEGAKVFVDNMWFRDIFPFLLERKVQGIFLKNQYGSIRYPKEYAKLVEANWNFVTLDRISAMQQAVEYLYSLGKRRISILKRTLNEPLHPFKSGMMAGYERCGLEFSEKMYCETESTHSRDELEKQIIKLWHETRFDALIVGCSDQIKLIYNTLVKRLKLKIPDDVALISFYDNPSYLELDVPVTAIDFPSSNVGREIVKVFDRQNKSSENMVFQATIIERESTRKGAGAYINHAFMPEISINDNLLI